MKKNMNRMIGQIFSYFRYALIIYEFSRLLFEYPEGSYISVIHGVFAVTGILSLVLDLINDIRILKTPQAIFSILILFTVAFSTFCTVGSIEKIMPEYLLQVAWFTLFLHISDKHYTRKRLLHEMTIVNYLILILTSVGIIFSLGGYAASKVGIAAFSGLPINTEYLNMNRFQGTFRWPTIMGLLNVIAILESCLFWKSSRVAGKIFLSLNITLQIVSLAMTRSRAPMVALVAALFITVLYLILHVKNKKAIIGITAVLFLGVVATYSVFKSRSYEGMGELAQYQNYLSSLPDQNAGYVLTQSEFRLNQISSSRIGVWKAAILVTSRLPFLIRGWGITNFNNIMSWVYPGAPENFPDLMHNMFIQSFLDAGLLGLISLSVLVILNIVNGTKVIRRSSSKSLFIMFLIQIAIGVFCCFDLGIWFRKWFYSGIFWLFGGYFWWLARYQDRLKRRDQELQ